MSNSPLQKQLIELCDCDRGIRYGIVKVGMFIPDGVPVIRGGDIRDGQVTFDPYKKVSEEISQKFSKTILQGGEIVINLIGEGGHSAIVPQEFKGFNVSRDVAVIPIVESVDKEYIDYLLRSPSSIEWFRQRLQGSVTQKINLETLKEFPVILPEFHTQKAISCILGTLDKKIELNKKINKNFEQIANTLFQSWFIDFDPVKAKVEKKSTIFSDEINNLFPDSFESSELGEIPAGWELCSLNNLVDFQNGYAFKSNNWKDSGIPVVKIGSIKPGIVDLSNVSYVDEEIAKSCKDFRLYPGDILIGMTGYVGEVGLVPRGNIAPLLNQRVGKLIPKNINYKSFVFCLARSISFRKKVKELSSGSAQANVSSMNICNIQLVKPKQKVLETFSNIIDNHLESYLIIHKESEILSNLRDVILPKLISGELRIPDAEKMISEAGI